MNLQGGTICRSPRGRCGKTSDFSIFVMNFVTNKRYAPARTGRSVCPFQVIPSADAVLASAKIGAIIAAKDRGLEFFVQKELSSLSEIRTIL